METLQLVRKSWFPDFSCQFSLTSIEQLVRFPILNPITYGGWLRNPAPPTGWLKPYKSWDNHP